MRLFKTWKSTSLSSGFATLVLVMTAWPARPQVYIPVPEYRYYGAIAHSSSTGISGAARNAATRQGAEKAAINVCAAGELTDCSVVAWFSNACGGLATAPDGIFGASYADGLDEAEAEALENCREAGGGRDCKIKQLFCTKG